MGPSSKELIQLVSDLGIVRPLPGLVRSLFQAGILVLFSTLAFSAESHWVTFGWCLLAGIVYSSLLVLTHDALHHTLTGWVWYDELFPRLISYPMIWSHGVYAELHTYHHKMNGNNLRDPERVSPTRAEYEAASPIGKWFLRNQFWFQILVTGGFGFLYSHFRQSLNFYKEARGMRRAFWTDLAGILVVQITINAVAIHYGVWTRWLIMFLVFERMLGLVHQFRSQIEHVGLWGEKGTPLETQIFDARNMKAGFFLRQYFNGLNYHSVHHAFPRIPWTNLRVADERLKKAFADAGRPWAPPTSYLTAAVRFSRNTLFIE